MTNNTRKRSTMHDVARYAGVAISTVSHVINKTANISEETKKRVLNAIAELDYSPNAMARGLRQVHTKLLAMLVPDLANEFYAKIATSFMNEAADKGYTVLVYNTSLEEKRELAFLQNAIERRIDGIVFIGGFCDDNVFFAAQSGIKVVLGDRYLEGFPSVEFNNTQVMKDLIFKLYETGYRKIGFVCESPDMQNVKQRFFGFCEGLEKNNLELNMDWVLVDKRIRLNKIESSRLVFSDYFNKNSKGDLPEIFLCSSDLVALGAMNAFGEKNIRVPEDISLVGYDDLFFARYINPPLSTVFQDTTEMSSQCFSLMLEQLTASHKFSQTNKPPHIVIENEIRLRESVRK